MQLVTDCLGARDTAGPPHHCSWDCRPQLSDVSDATEIVSPSLHLSSNLVHHILQSQPCNYESAQIYLDDQRLLGAVAHGAQGPVAEGVNGGQQHGADCRRNRHVQLRALRLGGRVGRRRGVNGGRAPLAAPQPGVLRQVQGACMVGPQILMFCAANGRLFGCSDPVDRGIGCCRKVQRLTGAPSRLTAWCTTKLLFLYAQAYSTQA